MIDTDERAPSLSHVIWMVPNATPVTSPVDETVAIDAFDVDQLTVRPVRGLPLASFSVAASWSVSPWRLSGIPLA